MKSSVPPHFIHDPDNFRQEMGRFCFLNIHPRLYIGTASDRYAGWLGQIYSPDTPYSITQRVQVVGGKRFENRILPIDSVQEYFTHFRALELDFTFYAPLLDPRGAPTRTYRTLAAYAAHLPDTAHVLLKVPQQITARRMWRSGRFMVNPDYLDAQLFVERFYHPAGDLLGPRLVGFIFEQEYQKKAERPNPRVFAAELDRFFTELPSDTRYHMEIRTEALWTPALYRVFKKHGVGQILSHWTWLPPLSVQFRKSGEQILNRSGALVIRWMTPRGIRYEKAYAQAHPFDRLVPGMPDPRMFTESARIIRYALGNDHRVYVLINNRAGGNAPLLARQLAFTLARQ